MRVNTHSTEIPNPAKLPQIGNAFKLARLVLVSPDIPAEALIANRANFLMNSIKQFEEVFLFSNEGDEVLRQISTTANYFSFPTRSNKFGYRLGNLCLPGRQWGIGKGVEWCDLTLGKMTIAQICAALGIIRPEAGSLDDLSARISYFDCTDCVDDTIFGKKGMLTLAKPGKAMKRASYNHLLLLLRYLLPLECPSRIDVHGGYFLSPFLSQLIYRLACLGYAGTVHAYGGEPQLNEKCKEHQVKALLTLQPNASGAVNS